MQHSGRCLHRPTPLGMLGKVIQHEWTTGHSPGHLIPIVDHSRSWGQKQFHPTASGGCQRQSCSAQPRRPRQHYYMDVAGQLALEVHGKTQPSLQHLVCIPDGAESPTFHPSQKQTTRSGLLPCSDPNLEPLSSLQNRLSHITTPRRLQRGHGILWGSQKTRKVSAQQYHHEDIAAVSKVQHTPVPAVV